ncbi:peptidylprolyl isomerase [Candidatus Pelagibacter sp.]|nr:peptidylprolyl isomerase [Candidatus Pelagibacter sp.]
MIKILLLSLLLLLPVKANETNIVIKVNNEIITNIDIENEIRYLVALNNELKETSKKILKNLAKQSVIKEKIKKKEVSKYFKFNTSQEFLDNVIKSYYTKLGIDSLENFKIYLQEYDLELDIVKNKIEIELLWNQLIGRQYQDQIIINKKDLENKVEKYLKENELTKEFNLSEIVFQIKNDNEIIEKKNLIKKDIVEKGFKSAANIYSISESSKFGGELGWIKSNQLSNKILDILTNLSIDELSEPIKIPNGYMILKINDIREITIEKDKEKLLDDLIKVETNNKYSQFSIIHYNKLKLNSVISE